MSTPQTIAGPDGVIELIEGGEAESRRGIVVCHPHPLYGGNMFDSVVDDVCSGAHRGGFASVRFNFRGVGGSEGDHDQGNGELEDLMAVKAWVGQRIDSVSIAGYSFGAGVASRCPDPVAKVLIAPPVAMLADDLGTAPILIIAGEQDPIVPLSDLEARLEPLANVTLSIIAGADHFFGSSRTTLKDEVTDFLVRYG